MSLVMKFGGASICTPSDFALVAQRIIQRASTCRKIVVVISAMANMTDGLLELARVVHPRPPERELDMLISAGERMSSALLAMALQLHGSSAVSLTGSQAGIITTNEHAGAKIIDVRPKRLLSELQQRDIVIVAGFQGVSPNGEITTLGRNGSDISAVALGVGVGADKVEFYKDVDGVYSEDPKGAPLAECYAHISYAMAQQIAQRGAEVLHPRAIALAARNGVPLHVLSFLKSRGAKGTWIGPRRRAGGDSQYYELGQA